MSKAFDWDSRIGRRLRLRDLHILFAVVQHGSMAKAAAHIGMSQSAISQAIAALEETLKVPVLDRTPRGVELTLYGAVLMRRGQAAFDELRAGIKDLDVLTDPGSGEVRIACTESIAAGLLPPAIERFSLRYPKVKLQVIQTSTHLLGFEALHERKADVVLTLLPKPFERDLVDPLQAEILFEDRICLAASPQSPWARRKLDLADLAEAHFIAPASDTPGGAAVIEAFRAAGLPAPHVTVTTFSVHVRNNLSMRGRFIAVLPVSVLRFGPRAYSLKELPVDVPVSHLPALIVTLKKRTLGAPVERFIACARDVAKAMGSPLSSLRPSTARRVRGAVSGKAQ